ncbi:pentatricopeptide repeat-containing protein At4g18975, chloroplastic-like [Silene latifolia]|uniref:pentatricopeptide repeat-containing protein At4g18975, chloroplastic-like n=1 Tax=Silene latifolia TaxID=37657 RepID=UPI003D777E42
MIVNCSRNPVFLGFRNISLDQAKISKVGLGLRISRRMMHLQRPLLLSITDLLILSRSQGMREHHLWKSKDSAGSGQKAMNLVRIDEAASLWNMILHTHTRSVSKKLFSRMTSVYHHHDLPDKIIEVFADMEELGVGPDEDTVRRVARAFEKLNQADKKRLVLERYGCKWKYIHFKGERVKVRRDPTL